MCKNRSLIQINGIYLHYLHTIQNEGDDFLVFKFHASGGHLFNLCILCHMKRSRSYPAKVLLFGEYTVLQGGAAMGLPIKNFSSKWQKGGFGDARVLLPFYYYLQECCPDILDLDQWYYDLQSGYFLQTNIPARAGLGSSGSLVAAVYDRYVLSAEKGQHSLQNILARMENFFHGTSSGFDPLLIYLDKPLVRNGSDIYGVENLELTDLYPWIMDSLKPRTGHPINQFNRNLLLPEFKQDLVRGTTITDQLIGNIIRQEIDQVWQGLSALSQWQYRHLGFLIPESLKQKWEQGLDEQTYLIKLCGAGGGGMYQVWTKAPEWPAPLGQWPRDLLRF